MNKPLRNTNIFLCETEYFGNATANNQSDIIEVGLK